MRRLACVSLARAGVLPASARDAAMITLRPLLASLVLLTGLFAAPTPARAAQSYDNCTAFIDTLPATISTQGTWCLRHDVTTAITIGNAITINTNNVTIDCNDFKIGGLQAGTGTTTYGIYATDRLNATVRHCGIRGFYYGILLVGGSGGGHLVEDNRFDGNTSRGLYVSGDGSLVQRNRVNTTGGSTVDLGVAYGITATYGVDILDNSVDGVAPAADNGGSGTAYGIYSAINLTGSLNGNRVRGLAPMGAGGAYGIFNSSSGRISLERNHVTGPGNFGLRCTDSTGRAKDNILGGFGTAVLNCADDGGNVNGP